MKSSTMQRVSAHGRTAVVAILLSLAALPAAAACTASTVADQASAIANGHAYTKHKDEFVHGKVINGLAFPNPTIADAGEFATFVAGIMNSPTQQKSLLNQRTGYWDASTGTVVVLNLHADDCGTSFRPTAGISYFNSLQ